MPARASRNNVLAGAFVIVAVIAFVATVVVLSSLGDAFAERKHYVVRFSLMDGAEGLDDGSPVKLGGQRVGKVTDTRFVFAPAPVQGAADIPTAIDVDIEVRADLLLFEDAIADLAKPLLGGTSAINIVGVTGRAEEPDYEGSKPPQILAEGGIIQGGRGSLGLLSRQDEKNVRDIISETRAIIADARPHVKPIMEDAQAGVARFREFGERIPGYGDKLDDILQAWQATSADFRANAARVADFLEKMHQAYDTNREGFDEIVQNLRELSIQAKGEGWNKVMAALDSAQSGIDSFNSAMKEADAVIASTSPQIQELIASGNIAAQQLKLLTMEVRSAPWRLLYQPNRKELENELLYNSVRQYSEAVADLHNASMALDAITARASAGADGGVVDQDTIDKLTERLRKAFERYQREEEVFLERWVDQSK